MSKYSEKLKDPRWQKKRLEILERDEFTCQLCFDSESTLMVHHKVYDKTKEPWEYENSELVTLCQSCHEYEHEARYTTELGLLKTLKRKGFYTEDIFELAYIFNFMNQMHLPAVIISALKYTMLDDGLQEAMIDNYFKSLKKDREKKAKDGKKKND